MSDGVQQVSDYRFEVMNAKHLDDVVAIETQVHLHPWTKGNFVDALQSGYTGEVVLNADGQIQGYFVCMPVIDEWHLLDISVDQSVQGRGLGHLLMNRLMTIAHDKKMQLILLEVRVSNAPAIRLYQRAGFTEIGRRKNYYPVDAHHREDAIMMQLTLSVNT